MHEIDTEELIRMREQHDDLPLINVLPEEQFRRRHIPGSENIPVSDKNFVQRVEETVGGRDKPVVVYCANEACDASATAVQRLEQGGFREVYDYTGGVQAWEEAGQAVQAVMG